MRSKKFGNLYRYTPVHFVVAVDYVWDGVLHAAVTRTLYIAHLLLRGRFIVTPAQSIKLCAVASYRLFHSHAQDIISYWLNEVNKSIPVRLKKRIKLLCCP